MARKDEGWNRMLLCKPGVTENDRSEVIGIKCVRLKNSKNNGVGKRSEREVLLEILLEEKGENSRRL